MTVPVFSKTLKKIQFELTTMHSFLISDPLVKETLFTSSPRLLPFCGRPIYFSLL